MKIKSIKILIVSGLLLAASIWIVVPGRNINGNPSLEEELQTCTFTDGTKATLYQGNGGASTAFWYSVTVEKGIFYPERQIAFSYSFPTWENLTCNEDNLDISGNLKIRTSDFSKYRATPIAIWKGEPEKTPRQWRQLDILRLATSLVLVVVAACLAYYTARNNKTA